MRSWIKVTAVAIATITAATLPAGCRNAPEKQEKAALSRQSACLATIPDGTEPSEIHISPDGRRAAYIVREGQKAVMVLDGKESARFDDIRRLVFSPDCLSVAFKATEKGKQFVVVNGSKKKAYDRIGSLQFAPDGRPVYEALRERQWVVVAGKRESPPFDQPLAMPIISANGQQIAYVEQQGPRGPMKLVVAAADMKTRTVGREYTAIARIISNTANSRVAFVGTRDGKQTVVSLTFNSTGPPAETEGPLFDQILTLDLSDDGKHLAYLAKKDKTVLLVRDGVELPFAEHEMRSQTLIANNGKTFNAGVIRGRFFPVVDGRRFGSTYDGIRDPVFSRDGSQLAFVVRNGDRHRVVVNGYEGPQYDMVVGPQFSPDGSRLIYRARQDGRRFVVLADTRGKTVKELPRYDMVWQPDVTSDSKVIAYAVKSGRELWWKVEPLH